MLVVHIINKKAKTLTEDFCCPVLASAIFYTCRTVFSTFFEYRAVY